MKTNRFSFQILAVVLSVLLLQGAMAPLQAQSQFQISNENGTTTYRVQTSRSLIEQQLKLEGSPAGSPDLSAIPWKVIKKWREDPVVSAPLTSVADIQAHAEELGEAIDQNLLLETSAKIALKQKVKEGSCSLGPLSSRFFELMVNKTSVVWKGEVEEQLALRTQACEFFLPGDRAVMVAVIMDCGNFTFHFTDSMFTAHAETLAPTPATPMAEATPPPPAVVTPAPAASLQHQSVAFVPPIDLSPTIKKSDSHKAAWIGGGTGVAIAIVVVAILLSRGKLKKDSALVNSVPAQ